MQQVHPNQKPRREATARGGENPSVIVRTDLSSLLSDYTTSQRRCNDRLEFLEREMASLKGQVSEVFTSSNEHELNETFTIKKSPSSQPTSARVNSSSRIPLPVTPRRLHNDEKPVVPANHRSASHPSPPRPVARSKTFHHHSSEEANPLRSYKIQLEQTDHKDAPVSDIRIPNYSSVEDVIKANEQLLLDNDRLRSDFNRLRTENILLLRSMKATTTGNEPYLGNERIVAERERQEMAMELARQTDENKRLRKSLLAQSAKFIALRQSVSNTPLSPANEHRPKTQSTTQPPANSSRTSHSKSARHNSNHRGFDRANTFHRGLHDPL